jgi:hypothetical protein
MWIWRLSTGRGSQLSHSEGGLLHLLTKERKRSGLLVVLDCVEGGDGRLAPRSYNNVSSQMKIMIREQSHNVRFPGEAFL